MIDISDKIETKRTAVAESSVRARETTIKRIAAGDTPKGDVLNVAKAAALLAAKKTPELIPHCHPISLDKIEIQFEVVPPSPHPLPSREGAKERGQAALKVIATVSTVSRTGVEMEALTAATVAALTIYDMAKAIDKELIIGETKLLEKHGGKSDYTETFLKPIRTAVLVTSDSVATGKKSDKSGKWICEAMTRYPVMVEHYEIVPDEKEVIRKKILGWVDDEIQLILTTGGTGLGPRDVTAQVAREIVEREVPGIAEAMRAFGQRRTPYAMLSRGVVGVCRQTLIITLPGSSRGVAESITAIFPNVLHAFNMMKGGRH